uniref:S1 motif domain-containing protein n=1 Tax=Amphimedon queenslandica TaxID=400682 RepID=A0A1X7VPS5_AMPQE
MYGTFPPIEYQMMIDVSYRTERALQLMVPGQLVEGFVSKVSSNGLTIELTELLPSSSSLPAVRREIADFRIKGLVKVENLASDPAKAKDALKEYQIDDVVQGLILGVEAGVVQVSFCTDNTELKLGYIDIDVPLPPKIPRPTDYIDKLTRSSGFKNPSCVDNLKSVLGLSTASPQSFSILRPISMTEIKDGEYYDSLRKSQRSKWSMDTVASGVECFKKHQYEDALKHFNYALEIDTENVEAMVARGALYANKGKYEKAIKDFESALTINHTHSNAKKYLVETQTAYGRELERQGEFKVALRCYREALADNPESEPAKTRAALLTAALEKKAAEMREKERKRREEEQRLKKLQKIIEKDRRHKKHKKKSKKRSSDRKRHHYSSDSSHDSPPHKH